MTRWRRLAAVLLLQLLLMGCVSQRIPIAGPPADATLLGTVAPLPARQASSPPAITTSATLPSEFLAVVEFARTMGTLIARHQRAMQIATASQTSPEIDGDAVTEQIDGDGTIQVNFVRSSASARQPSAPPVELQVYSSIRVAATHSTRETASVGAGLPRSPSEFEFAKLRARRTALRAASACCGPNPAAVLISWRRDATDVFYAYVFAATPPTTGCEAMTEVVVGGNGANVLALRALSNQCAPPNPDELLLQVSTTTRAAPAATDVFLALRLGRPLQLHTKGNDLNWLVSGDRIALLDRPRNAAATACGPAAPDQSCAH